MGLRNNGDSEEKDTERNEACSSAVKKKKAQVRGGGKVR